MNAHQDVASTRVDCGTYLGRAPCARPRPHPPPYDAAHLSIAMRNVSICFYVFQQHVECFQIADKRCKIKQQLRAAPSWESRGERGSRETGSSSLRFRLRLRLRLAATTRNNTKRQTKRQTHERRRISVSLNSGSSMESWEPTFHIPRVLLFCSLRFDLIFCAFLLPPFPYPGARWPWSSTGPSWSDNHLFSAALAKTKPNTANSNSSSSSSDGQSQQDEILSAVFDIEHDRFCARHGQSRVPTPDSRLPSPIAGFRH